MIRHVSSSLWKPSLRILNDDANRLPVNVWSRSPRPSTINKRALGKARCRGILKTTIMTRTVRLTRDVALRARWPQCAMKRLKVCPDHPGSGRNPGLDCRVASQLSQMKYGVCQRLNLTLRSFILWNAWSMTISSRHSELPKSDKFGM